VSYRKRKVLKILGWFNLYIPSQAMHVTVHLQTVTYHDIRRDSFSDLAEPLMAPLVQIQGGRNQLSSKIYPYSDYEFPLDEQWELKPRNRFG